MNAKTLKNGLLIACIPLLLAACGKPREYSPGEVPATLSDTLKIRRSSKTFVITGFGSSGDVRAAIINDQIVVPGMELDSGVVLSEIHPTYVVIRHGNTEYRIRPADMQDALDKEQP